MEQPSVAAVGVRLFWLVVVAVIWILAYEGNLGKGLACLIAPMIVEVNGNGGQNTASSITTS